MNNFSTLLHKEWMEIRRTWRIWVLPGPLFFFGVLAPIMAKVTPALVESIATSQPGTVIQIPNPVASDAYLQFTKSLNQIVLIALIIASAELISGERRSGTLLLVLTKPISRAAFVLAKFVAQCACVLVPLVLSAFLCWIGTELLFDGATVSTLLQAIALWFVLAVFIIAMMTLLSTLMRAQAGAAGIGIALYAGVILLGQWEPARKMSPGGLFGSVDQAIRGEPMAVLGPIVATLALTAICLIAAIWSFQRTEFTNS